MIVSFVPAEAVYAYFARHLRALDAISPHPLRAYGCSFSTAQPEADLPANPHIDRDGGPSA
jgi:hypothetical protein